MAAIKATWVKTEDWESPKVNSFNSKPGPTGDGADTPFSTTGSTTVDELFYFKKGGFDEVTLIYSELLGEAGELNLYGLSVDIDDIDPSGSGVRSNHAGKFGRIGDAIAVSANDALCKTIDGPYETILVCFSKTSAGAGASHIGMSISGE